VVAFWGAVFVVLLLLSAGMVTVPGHQDRVAFVREFYEDHRAVIVTAQVIGVVASAAFLAFALGLQRQDWVGRRPLVHICGVAVAVAGALACVPPLVLCVVASSAGRSAISGLATASDRVDVVLFAAIAFFAGSVLIAVDRVWVRALAALVGVMCALRAFYVLMGEATLELLAPMAFLVLIMCLAILSWRRALGRIA